MNKFVYALLSVLAFVCVSCENNDNTSPTEFNHLVSYQKVATISSTDIIQSVKLLNPEADCSSATHDVDYYKITYHSTYINKDVILSGLIMVPTHTTDSIKHFQYTHGSMFPINDGSISGERSTDAPSLFNHINKTINGYEFYEVRSFGLNIAARGCLVSMPDYCGYGISEGVLEHTYVCAPNLAQESYDMILATREFAQHLHLKLSENIALSGWSEGASVSMYEQKIIEQNNTIKVDFNNCLAGPYFLETISSFDETIESADLCLMSGWTVLSHCLTQDINPAQFFKNNIVDWNTLLYACAQPNPSLQTIFNEETIQNREALSLMLSKSNTAKGWIPQGTMHLYHGQQDYTVPYFNTQMAIEEFKAAGTPDDRVVLHTYPEGNHVNFVWDLIDQTIQLLTNNK